jgi:Fe-S-cluster containining protein
MPVVAMKPMEQPNRPLICALFPMWGPRGASTATCLAGDMEEDRGRDGEEA